MHIMSNRKLKKLKNEMLGQQLKERQQKDNN